MLNFPEQGDYILFDSGRLGSRTSVSAFGGKHLNEFPGDEEALAFVKKDMKEHNFFPDVWSLSDHGNFHIITDLSF